MTTLGSWIDDEALAQVIRELCPEEAVGDASAVAKGDPSTTKGTETDGTAEESVPLESLPPALPPSAASGNPAALVSRLAAVKQRAQRSGLIGGAGKVASTSDPDPAAAENFVPPVDTLAVRLEYLNEWIKARFNIAHVCFSDSRGELLAHTTAPTGLSASAALMADALMRLQSDTSLATNSALHSGLEGGQVLTVIAAPTMEGLFSISLIAAAPLSRRDVETCRNAFYATIDVSVSS